MSIVDLEGAFRLIAENKNIGFFAGPRDPALIVLAERALGCVLSPMYREFVARLGAGNFGSFEIYGVIDEDFENSSVPNGVWLTLSERKNGNLPHGLIIIGGTGDGGYYCMEQIAGLDCPVFIHREGASFNSKNEKVARDFGEFLFSGVRRELM